MSKLETIYPSKCLALTSTMSRSVLLLSCLCMYIWWYDIDTVIAGVVAIKIYNLMLYDKLL